MHITFVHFLPNQVHHVITYNPCLSYIHVMASLQFIHTCHGILVIHTYGSYRQCHSYVQIISSVPLIHISSFHTLSFIHTYHTYSCHNHSVLSTFDIIQQYQYQSHSFNIMKPFHIIFILTDSVHGLPTRQIIMSLFLLYPCPFIQCQVPMSISSFIIIVHSSI